MKVSSELWTLSKPELKMPFSQRTNARNYFETLTRLSLPSLTSFRNAVVEIQRQSIQSVICAHSLEENTIPTGLIPASLSNIQFYVVTLCTQLKYTNNDYTGVEHMMIYYFHQFVPSEVCIMLVQYRTFYLHIKCIKLVIVFAIMIVIN